MIERRKLIDYILQSQIFQQWHYFSYHFGFLRLDAEHWLAKSVIDACVEVDDHVPGFASAFIDSLAEIGGLEKHEPHYEQLLQQLAESLVIRRITTWKWPLPVKFDWEPTARGSKKNPEVSVTSNTWMIGLEVKAPSLLQHIRLRSSNVTQLSSRLSAKNEVAKIPGAEGGVTVPRDNPIKDFLLSAEAKFVSFRRQNPQFYGVLVIVWDDFVYEPITALIHGASGLFTPNSFARDDAGQPLTFSNVDTVVIVPHLHQLLRSTRDEPLADGLLLPLDYGDERQFPFKACIQNPHGRIPPNEVLECLQAMPQHSLIGAEYQPSDLIWWINPRDPSSWEKRGLAKPSEGDHD